MGCVQAFQKQSLRVLLRMRQQDQLSRQHREWFPKSSRGPFHFFVLGRAKGAIQPLQPTQTLPSNGELMILQSICMDVKNMYFNKCTSLGYT